MNRFLLIALLTAYVAMMPALVRSQERVKPRDPPKDISGRDIMYTYEGVMRERLKRRVDPVCAGVHFAPPAAGLRSAVLEIYIEAQTGEVIFAEAVEAPNREISTALKTAVMQWRYEPAVATRTVIATPATFFFSGSAHGRCGDQ